jgi:hypothetical protein
LGPETVKVQVYVKNNIIEIGHRIPNSLRIASHPDQLQKTFLDSIMKVFKPFYVLLLAMIGFEKEIYLSS